MPSNRFTIYDAMERAGAFDSNPANTFARDKVTGASLYKGPVPYPKMFYHPEGEQNVIVPGEWIQTLRGPQLVGEQKEIIWKIAENPDEEGELRADGWHDHPAKAIRARVEGQIARGELPASALKTVPAISSDQRIKDLEAELARITAARDAESIAREAEEAAPLAAKAASLPKLGVPLAPGLGVSTPVAKA
jgi:hypothetical protein